MNITRSKANSLTPVASANLLNNDASTNIANKIQSVTNTAHSPSIPLASIGAQRYQDFLPPVLLSKFQQDPSFVSRCLAQLDSAMLAPSETGITKTKCALLHMLLQGKTLREVCCHCAAINSRYQTDISISKIEKLSLMLEYYLVGGLKLVRSFSLHHNSTSFPASVMHFILTFFENEKGDKVMGKTSGFKINETIKNKVEMGEIFKEIDVSNIPSGKIIERFIANCGYKKNRKKDWIFEYESSQFNELPSIEDPSKTTQDSFPASSHAAQALEEETLPELIPDLTIEELGLDEDLSILSELFSQPSPLNEQNITISPQKLSEEEEIAQSTNLSELFDELPIDKQKLLVDVLTTQVDENVILEEQALGLNNLKDELASVMVSFDSLASLQPSLEEVSELIENSTLTTLESPSDPGATQYGQTQEPKSDVIPIQFHASTSSESDSSEAFCDFWLSYFQSDSLIPAITENFENFNDVASSQCGSEDISTLVATLNTDQHFLSSSGHIVPSINPFSNLTTDMKEIEALSTSASFSFTTSSEEQKDNQQLTINNDSNGLESATKRAPKRKHPKTSASHPIKMIKATAPLKLRIPLTINTKISIAHARRAEYIDELNRGMENDAEEAANKIKFFVVKSLLNNKKLSEIKADCEYLFDREKVKHMKLTDKKILAMRDYYLLGGLTLLRGFAWSVAETYPAALMQLALEIIKKKPLQTLATIHSKLCIASQGKIATPSYTTFRDFAHRCGYYKNLLGEYTINEALATPSAQTSATEKSTLFYNIPPRPLDKDLEPKVILEIVDQNKNLSIRRLSRKTGCTPNKIKYALRKNGYVYENLKWQKKTS